MGASPAPPAPSGFALSQDQKIASSCGWLAVSLNLGFYGMGYVYQRRWGAFWLGGLAAVGAAVALGGGGALVGSSLSSAIGSSATPEAPDRTSLIVAGASLGGYAGLFGVAVGSSVEAGLAVNRARRRLQG